MPTKLMTAVTENVQMSQINVIETVTHLNNREKFYA